MAGRRWDEYSKYILEMHKGLISFNFYGSVDRLKDVITPSIQAIDRRKVEFRSKKGKGDDGLESQSADALDDEEGDLEPRELSSSELKKIRNSSWYGQHLAFLESLNFMVFILVLVLVAVGITIWQVIEDAEESFGLMIFGFVVLAIFLYDYFMRLYCYWYVNREISKFVKNHYNLIDMFVILIDLIFIGIPADVGGSASNFSKSLRLIRLVRLVRVLRAAKVINYIVKKKEEVIRWNAPARYTKIPQFELDTMTEAIDILMFVQGVIEDRNLSILLRYFYAWEGGLEKRTPAELFLQAVEDGEQLTLAIDDFDDIFIDNIMFKHKALTQGALEVLQARHSLRETLMSNINEVQLLVSPKRERQFRLISSIVQQLERNAETHELWGELATDVDHATNKQTKEIMQELIDLCRVRCTHLEFNLDYVADSQIQNLLRNLGLFEISLKVLGLMDSVEEDENGEFDEVSQNTRELCSMCNDLIYWFTLGNAANQQQVYGELESFLDALDDDIKSHKVIRAIFKDNEDLMKVVPFSFLNNMADKIVTDGKSHHYLALASSITHVGEKNITKNQFAVVKSLCSPSRLDNTALWLCPVASKEYAEKIEIMESAKHITSDDLDDLPPELAYHLNFLEILSNCTIGRLNITSIEAKVQSLFDVTDIVAAILHPQTTLIVKKFLTLHFFNAIIEVEIMIPGLEMSACVWDLLQSYRTDLKHITEHIKIMDDLTWMWENPANKSGVTRTHIEYYLACIMVIQGFFGRYYNANALGKDDTAGVGEDHDTTKISVEEADELMKDLFDHILPFFHYNCIHLTQHHHDVVFDALEALNKSSSKPFYQDLQRKVVQEATAEVDEEDLAQDVLHEMQVHQKFREFLEIIDKDEDIKQEIQDESKLFISCIERMPYLSDTKSDSEIRFEPFIQKLVSHIRENMSTVDGERRIVPECVSSVTFVIKAFRTMIENKMGMTIFERDDEGGDEEDERAAPTVTALNENGVVGICVDLIAIGVPDELQMEVIKLMTGMLFKEGGAREVQSAVHDYLIKTDSELFFKQCRHTIHSLIAWHKWNDVIILEEDDEPEPPESILLIRMLQLLSEGHYLPNQDIMREQPCNNQSINLLDDFVQYFNTLSRIRCRTSTAAATAVGDVIVEVIQGPCVGNQTHFALNTDLLEVQNRVLRSKTVNDCDDDEEIGVERKSAWTPFQLFWRAKCQKTRLQSVFLV